ncbi:hypothetical protein BDZ97DRAFT_2052948 [Flammula alnicola]|nr:hypothetical protein BDZ97DRAFT_2052948 [Flammula alnicola]
MPEYMEFHTDYIHIDYFINNTSSENRLLKGIFIDATAKELKSGVDLHGSPAASGHVYELESSSTILRGGATKEEKKTHVYPNKYATPVGAATVAIYTRKLCLVGVETAPRATILEFKEDNGRGESYWCQAQLFTHTNVQIFTVDEWRNGICKVDRSTRGFKVGFAFEFEIHVLAFLTLDLLIQAHWSDTRQGLLHSPADIVMEYPLFLQELVTWMIERRKTNSTRTSIAMNVIRDHTDIFCGAGVYTIQEVFHRAGLSPNLVEFEIFDCPSRTARLVAAYYHFCLQVRKTAWLFIKQFLCGFLCACRREDRALYAQELAVYGKDRTNHSVRFKRLLTQFKSCLEIQDGSESEWIRIHGASGVPFDVFEPDHIQHALEHKGLDLGSLIFGGALWMKLASDNDLSIVEEENTLSKYFSANEFDRSKTWLHPEHYDYLFNASSLRQGMTAWSQPRLYRWSETNVWSVIPVYPVLSHADVSSRALKILEAKKATKSTVKATKTKALTPKKVKIDVLDENMRMALLLQNVTQHSEVYTVGPLDFCGVAQIITGGGGKPIVMVCKMDPRKSLYCVQRHILGAATAKLKGKGLEKKGIDRKTKVTLLKKISKRQREDDDKENSDTLSTLSSSSPIPPRKRRSQNFIAKATYKFFKM